MTGGPIGSAVGALTAGAGDARYAKQSNNLSDLSSASSARTHLGLGASAVMSTAQIAADAALAGTFAGLLPAASSYTYNVDGTIDTETVGGVATTYTYNADGTIATQARAGVTRTYSYNADGTIASVT